MTRKISQAKVKAKAKKNKKLVVQEVHEIARTMRWTLSDRRVDDVSILYTSGGVMFRVICEWGEFSFAMHADYAGRARPFPKVREFYEEELVKLLKKKYRR